ncbi:ABC transporter substrate-binding protein [Pseudolabrys taiwanensis]|uniref:ABC transporter substrate-binding protein n=1 Tax=Pseudolabrys taiwanensis TaxID=331696 RepID=A0A346A3H4_9HYPH|nr:ABC transporter substrate-binding protein [Pseudolabrys taiwanensis]AXK83721.1 ABC transporter substrate-binding protein [Pseudolabrys taiwanensis]
MRRILAAMATLAALNAPVLADDTLKVAVGQLTTWENQMTLIGQDAGIFKKHGIVLENFGTNGAGETLQAVISGSADIGIGMGTSGAMRAFVRGAPVRMLAPAFTGSNDLYWYVKADSPIKSLADTTESQTIAYSTNGSSTHSLVIGFGKELGLKAKPTATGGPPATLTLVMSGQIDIGWASPPFGLKEIDEGKIRVLARGSAVPSTRNQTVRVQIVNANLLREKKDVIERFMKAYREAIEWMYSDPKAIEMYAAKMKVPVALIKKALPESHPRSALQADALSDADGIMRDAVTNKFLDKPLTKEQLAEFYPFPALGK